MNIEKINARLHQLENDETLQNLIAQADARYILFNTAEKRENFPAYTIKDDNLNILAFHYLDIGCSFAEQERLDLGKYAIEKGSSILEFIHASASNKTDLSDYYCLIAALAYYVSLQYSKSYILISKIKTNTITANLVALFLERNFNELIRTIETIMVDESYSDEFIARYYELGNELANQKVYEITIAKCLNSFVKYFQTGDRDYLSFAHSYLETLKEITELNAEPSMWWIVRLLLLIAEGFNQAALWNAISPYFDIDSPIVKKYIYSLVFLEPKGIFELFITQRESLSKVLDKTEPGCIVTIPTSSGKTRIAEIAILDSFINNPTKKVLYIAPFRSLAFEIENSLENILSNLTIQVSHLYGGSLYSFMDEQIIKESNVIIATPEKAKAIIRGNREIANAIGLVVIDEGHLLGANKRLISTEIFYEELRYFIRKNKGRFLLLSAVLPNPEDLSLWLTNSKDNVYKDSWRPSDERLGILEWTGSQVNLNWINNDEDGRQSFNKKFIVSKPQPLKPRQRKPTLLPGDKNEAVAATAIKLKEFGTVLIFVGQKRSVFKMAESYLKCLDDHTEDYQWENYNVWKTFELSSIEIYGENNKWLEYAKKGILCHHGQLHADVRLPLERLMRKEKPPVIISTSTLGQGVNLGVSSVIFSTIQQGEKPIPTRDFWNIAGRAGRAFVDHEGKILVVQETVNKSKYKIIYEQNKINEYFDKANIDVATSGLLMLINALKMLVGEVGISFDNLLQLIAENSLANLNDKITGVDETLDWIDDTLLALQELNNPIDEIDITWVEEFFRNSLAFIQLSKQQICSEEQLINFFKARVQGIIKKVGEDREKWKSITNSGIPLNSDLFLEEKINEIINLCSIFGISEQSVDDKILLAIEITEILKEMPVLCEKGTYNFQTENGNILNDWLEAEPIAQLEKHKNYGDIISDLFTFKLPWVFNGIAKKLRVRDLNDEAEIIEELAMLIEVGVPTINALQTYRAGIRSRMASSELSILLGNLQGQSSRKYKDFIIRNKDALKQQVSRPCQEWIDLLDKTSSLPTAYINSFSFTFSDVHEKTKLLVARKINGKQYLTSPDLSFMQPISINGLDFSKVNKANGIFFRYNDKNTAWEMVNHNPYLEIIYI